jgi:diguanylate cyclase (GGDEF)-like protein
MVGEGLVAGLDRNREGAMTSNGEYVFWERAEPNAEDSAHLREYARIVEAWRDAFREAAGPLATMAVADDAKTLDALERQFAASMERLQRGTGQLPIEVSARLGPLVEELDSVATGGHGLVPAARSRLNTAARLAGVLAESRYFADRMAARVKSLVDSIGQGVAQRSQGFERQVERGIAAALVMALAFTIAALGVAFYVNGNVLRRLRRLRESMDDYLESGRPRIPAEGDDEIGDIARAFRYFVGEIGSREERLRRLAATDVLTGASNRRHFLEQSLRELQRAKRYGLDLCLVMLDLDRFKEINDRYGHANGDEALKAFVHACRGVLREVDLLGRLGGEEFAVLLPETGAAGAREVAERLRERVMRLGVPSGSRILRFTVSAGITMLRAEDESVDALLHRADAALYEAKRSGRNRVVLGRMAPLRLSPVETSNAPSDSGSDPS